MTGQHVHVITYKYPIFGQREPDQELKKKKITKPTPPINPGLYIFFVGPTAVNFPKAAAKKSNDLQK